MQRDQFPVAVPAHHVGPQTEALQHVEPTQTGSANRRLRNLRLLQLLGLTLRGLFVKRGMRVDVVAEALLIGTFVVRLEDRIGGVKDIQELRKLAGQIAHHAHILRALPREEHSQFADGFRTAEDGTLRGAPAFTAWFGTEITTGRGHGFAE